MTHRPLLLFALALATGVLFESVSGATPLLFLAAGLAGILLMALGRGPLFFLTGLILLGGAAGGVRTAWYAVVPASDISHFAAAPLDRGPYVTLQGDVSSEPEFAHDRESFILSADRISAEGKSSRVTGSVYLSLPVDDAHSAAYGEELAVTGFLIQPRGVTNPGGFDWARYLAQRVVRCTMSARWSGAVHPIGYGGSWILRLAGAARGRIVRGSEQALPPERAAVLAGILVGTRSAIPGELHSDFVHTGTVHILATAGVHVGVVVACLIGLGRLSFLPRRARAAAAAVVLVVFIFAAGGHPAVVRAGSVATIWLGGKILEREPDLLTSLGLSACLILLLQPTALFEPGFQLSYVTVGIICAAMPAWQRLWVKRLSVDKLTGIRRTLATGAVDLVGITLFAQLGSLPIVAAYYNEISLCGGLANLVVVPLLFFIIPTGFLAAAAPGPVSQGLFQIAGFFVGWVEAIVRVFASVPMGYLAVTTPSALGTGSYYAILLSGILWLNRVAPKEVMDQEGVTVDENSV